MTRIASRFAFDFVRERVERYIATHSVYNQAYAEALLSLPDDMYNEV
jgi:hypothetical protein